MGAIRSKKRPRDGRSGAEENDLNIFYVGLADQHVNAGRTTRSILLEYYSRDAASTR
jgi:hypothetical protein